MSPSGPYIYNPKECVILAYKDSRTKQSKGTPEWDGQVVDVIDKTGKSRKKTIHSEKDKKEFMELVFGRWKYRADKQTLTKATFSLDIPLKAIKILTYKEDVILDPFMGSGTTALAAEMLERNWVGFEKSSKYCKTARKRIREHIDSISQLEIFD
jgi:site-specific DNA-methyltransferase (adenine-specific)